MGVGGTEPVSLGLVGTDGFRINLRLFTVLYFSARSPRLHVNSKTGTIFVFRASQPPTLISPTHAPSVDCRPLSRLRSQYKQRWRPFRSSRAIVAILRKKQRTVNSLYKPAIRRLCFCLFVVVVFFFE